MRNIVLAVLVLAFSTGSRAATNGPARLAIVSESPAASAVADVLTAVFSGNNTLQLLERDEIAKVIREHGLSAGNKDGVRLGEILGADGMLLAEIAAQGSNKVLNVQLLAVKPGVVLNAEQYPWPLDNLPEWSTMQAKRLEAYLPKLTVLAKEAIPISVVNLRSSISSDEAQETERELKILAIQRLSRERSLFVLERQRMQLLEEEKSYKMDDSAFWGGSYLLEGVVDQNGYSKDTITIDARLAPPKGGAPLRMSVSGDRTNLTEVIHRLAGKVMDALKVANGSMEWKPGEEAAQYYEEAKWALRWEVFNEARSAANAAWALGKKDLECAMVRIKAYKNEIPVVLAPNANRGSHGKLNWLYVHINEPPDPKYCDIALAALRYYYDFSRNSPDGEAKILYRGKGWNDWHNSEWYQLGIDTLAAASNVLKHYVWRYEWHKPVASKLVEIRSLARSVAALIAQQPTVHDSFYVGSRAVTSDELYRTMLKDKNIFGCMTTWGCYWQEKPEDTIALYRELMSNPVFAYVHEDMWYRPVEHSRLVAWNPEDGKRLRTVWNQFLRESDDSTNVFFRMEGKVLEIRYADGPQAVANAITNFYEALLDTRLAFTTNNVDVLYMNWGIDELSHCFGEGMLNFWGANNVKTSSEIEEIRSICKHYLARLKSKDVECQEYLKEKRKAQAFEKQKQFLKDFVPFEPVKYHNVFEDQAGEYSKAQAAEIMPLLAAYKTNITGVWAKAGIAYVSQQEMKMKAILNPSAHVGQRQTNAIVPISDASTPVKRVLETKPNGIIVTPDRILEANRFSEIPWHELSGNRITGVRAVSHRWFEGKLLLDLEYNASIYSPNMTRIAELSAIAVLDPIMDKWNIIECPEVDIMIKNRYYNRSVLWHDQVFTSNGGQVKKYDAKTRDWIPLEMLEGGQFQLFNLDGRLYAVDKNSVLEIIDGGKSIRILASTRRRPPASLLDTQEFENSILFEGPGRSLRIVATTNIYTWKDNDWRHDFSTPPGNMKQLLFSEGVLFRQNGRVLALPANSNELDLCFWQKLPSPNYNSNPYSRAKKMPEPKPRWKVPPQYFLPHMSVAMRQSGLFLWEDHSVVRNIAEDGRIVRIKVEPKDGYHASLLHFSNDSTQPQQLYLKFDHPDGMPPAAGMDAKQRHLMSPFSPVWMLCASNYLICGLEGPNDYQFSTASYSAEGYKYGIWMIPLAQLDAAIEVEKQIQRKQLASAEAEAKKYGKCSSRNMT